MSPIHGSIIPPSVGNEFIATICIHQVSGPLSVVSALNPPGVRLSHDNGEVAIEFFLQWLAPVPIDRRFMAADVASFIRVCGQYRKQCVVYVEHPEALNAV